MFGRLIDLLDEEVLEWAGGVGGRSPPLSLRRWCLSVWRLATCELDPFVDSACWKRRGLVYLCEPDPELDLRESGVPKLPFVLPLAYRGRGRFLCFLKVLGVEGECVLSSAPGGGTMYSTSGMAMAVMLRGGEGSAAPAVMLRKSRFFAPNSSDLISRSNTYAGVLSLMSQLQR